MTGWRATLEEGVLYGMWFWYPLVYVAYLIIAGVRRRVRRPRSFEYWSGSVRFHAWWGIVLSVPGVTIAVLGGLGPRWHWIGGVALVATLGCWVVALMAASGRPLQTGLAWMPLITVVVSLNAFAALAGFPAEPGGADAGSRYWMGLLFMSDVGLGLLAWLVVTISFALSCQRDRVAAAVVAPPAQICTPAAVSVPE